MSISGIGAGSGSSLLQQRRQELKDMLTAVQSGDMAGAQQSLTALQQGATGAQTGAPPTPQQIDVQGSAALTDFAALISSVQSGDIGAAQTALTAFQQDQGPAPAASDGADSSSSAFLTDLTNLLQAVQSGDASSARADAAAVAKDLQTATDGTSSVGGHHHHHHHHGGGSGSASTSTSATSTDASSPSDSLLADLLASYQGDASSEPPTG